MRKFSFLMVGVVALGLLMADAVEASHFRFGHITWRRISGTQVEITSITAWRSDFVDGVSLNFGDNTSANLGQGTQIASGPGYSVRKATVIHNYPGNGPYTISFGSCCRISGLVNAANANYSLQAVVDLRNGNQGSPVSSIPVILQMVQGGLNSVPLPIADIDGDPISCRLATSAESGFNNPSGLVVNNVAGQCVLAWDTSSTNIGQQYAVQIVINDNHQGGASQVALDFMIVIVDGTLNGPPVCVLNGSASNILQVGVPFALTITGTDPDGDNLTVGNQGLPPGATLSPTSGSSPLTTTFSWTPSISDRGQAYAVSTIFSDPGGLQALCSFSLSVPDNQPPQALCKNITVNLDASGNASIVAGDVNNGSSDPDGDPITLSVSPSSFTCANVGANTVTLTVSDGSRTATCPATVTVQDVTAPTAAAQNVTVQLDAAGNASVTAAAVDNGSSDVCGIASLSVSPSSFTCANVGANPVILTVTDNNGNSSTANATVTVQDNVAPTAIAQGVTVQLDAAGNASVTAAAVDNGSSDVCGIASLAVSPSSFTCADVGANAVTLTVTDNNGNSSTASATVTVEDNVAPTAAAQAVTVQLDAAGNGSVTAAAVDNGSSDACGIASLSVSPSSFTCAEVGANAVTLTVTDNNGNSSTASATVTVEDNVAPTAIAQGVTVQLDASGNASVTAAAVDNGSSDACGIASLAVSPSSFTCAEAGANPVTLTVTDNNGNSSTANATVTVEDVTPPIAVAQDVTIQLDAAGNGSVTAAAVNNGSSDACGIVSMAVSPSSFTCAEVGANAVTLTVTDGNGNSSTASATVTVEDNVAPTAAAQDVTVQLDAAGNGSVTAAAVDNGSSDACGIASLSVSPSSFGCANVGANTVTLTVTDNNGNSSSATATVTVEDNVDPVAVAQDITVQLDASGNASIGVADIENGSNDACGIASVSIDVTSFTCANVGANTVTLTAVDNNGNSGSAQATVTVEDNVAPVALAQDITINLDAFGNASITALDIDAGSTDACGIQSLSVSPNSFICVNLNANTVTLTVTDNNGNVSTATATVTVLDVTAPDISFVSQFPDAFECVSHQGTPVDLSAVASDACDTDLTFEWYEIINGSARNLLGTGASLPGVVFPLGTHTVEVDVTDDSGNMSTGYTSVTIEDTTLPVVTLTMVTQTLWPPNHEMHLVATGTYSDVCDPSPVLNAGSMVSSNEPLNSTGDGDTEADWSVVDNGDGTFAVYVRAERKGNSDGRIYTITPSAIDGSTNTSPAVSSTVSVVHDQGTTADAGSGGNGNGKGKGKGRSKLVVPQQIVNGSGLLTLDGVLDGPQVAGALAAQGVAKFDLHQNYPNPFNPETIIQYTLTEASAVRLVIYNLTGQQVRELVNTSQGAGLYAVRWDGNDAAGQQVTSGLYLYRLEAGSQVAMRKMLLLK